jgi:hypothetical protein
MGCNCGGKNKLPKLPRAQPLVAEVMEDIELRTYTNISGSMVSSRNPRFMISPGQSIDLDEATISHQIRHWVRDGTLRLEPLPDSDPPVAIETPVEPVVVAPVKAATKKPTKAAA